MRVCVCVCLGGWGGGGGWIARLGGKKSNVPTAAVPTTADCQRLAFELMPPSSVALTVMLPYTAEVDNAPAPRPRAGDTELPSLAPAILNGHLPSMACGGG